MEEFLESEAKSIIEKRNNRRRRVKPDLVEPIIDEEKLRKKYEFAVRQTQSRILQENLELLPLIIEIKKNLRDVIRYARKNKIYPYPLRNTFDKPIDYGFMIYDWNNPNRYKSIPPLLFFLFLTRKRFHNILSNWLYSNGDVLRALKKGSYNREELITKEADLYQNFLSGLNNLHASRIIRLSWGFYSIDPYNDEDENSSWYLTDCFYGIEVVIEKENSLIINGEKYVEQNPNSRSIKEAISKCFFHPIEMHSTSRDDYYSKQIPREKIRAYKPKDRRKKEIFEKSIWYRLWYGNPEDNTPRNRR